METSKSLDRNQPKKRLKNLAQAPNPPVRSSLDLHNLSRRMNYDAKEQLTDFAAE